MTGCPNHPTFLEFCQACLTRRSQEDYAHTMLARRFTQLLTREDIVFLKTLKIDPETPTLLPEGR